MKAVIADDEIKVCKLIKKLLDWEKLGIKLIGEVDNGLQALDLIINEKPEIVITDIRMPGLDGLELIKRVREAGLKTSFVIISGHKQFEYAQSAVKYGVEDYLLKPINREELHSIVVKLRNRYIEDAEKAEDEMKLKIQLANSIDKLRKQFIVNLLNNQDKFSVMSLGQINKEYHFNFADGYFQIIALKLDKKNGENINDSYEELMINKLSGLTKKSFKNNCRDIEASRIDNRVICLLNYSLEDFPKIEISFKKVFEQLKDYLEISENFYLTMGIGTVENNIISIEKSISSALNSINCRVVLGVDKIINLSKYNFTSINIEKIITQEKEKELIHYIEVFDKVSLKQWMNNLFSKISEKLQLDPFILFKACSKIVDIFIVCMKTLNMENEEFTKDNILKKIDECKRPIEVQKYMVEFISEYLDVFITSKKMQENKPIRIAKQYVAENYMKSISLEDIANIVHLNPVYFSVIFKKEVGINFMDFLINYRLEIAKELLKEDKYNISQVAYMVGYKDAKHFSKLFAKVVGIKPMEFRKIYS
ncbi:response regulator [Clostridium sp. SYSU_GA19001]|uniref:response regulator transcription factor n=1 Tax=Clostridium caldaquaticum TaxID=2940653 RepID=UPI0020771AFB|nr:response regulator [Clostridium caldaquaticum]MCM8710316.1 response regulator [Clostridium caldaquaticum]